MSDEDDFRKMLDIEKYKHRVRVNTKHCLTYVRKKSISDKDVIMTVHLPYESLRGWSDCQKKASLLPCGSCSYVKILNAFLYENCGYKVKEGCQRVENRLVKACSEVRRKFVGKNGTAYRKLCEKEIQLALELDEFVTVSQIEGELVEEMVKCDGLEKNNEVLVEALSKAQNHDRATSETLSNAEREIEELKDKNKNLHSYIEKLGQNLEFQNYGKKLTEVGERQKRRKLTELKTHAEKALWFAETFGLHLKDVNFVDDNGSQHHMSYSSKDRKAYKDLPEEDQHKIKSMLFVLDKFCIGDAAYHELTMVAENCGLPRSYLIKQCKNELNKMTHITRTPGTAEGAQLDFNTELKTVVQKMIEQNIIDIDDPNLELKVKLSGDGAKMSRLTNFIVISFSVLNKQSDVMSSKGNHTVAIVKGHESYELLQMSCSKVLSQVNKLVESKKVAIDGKDISVEVYLGGDYKFLLLLLGMKSATSDYACIWCKIDKKDRSDMSKSKDFYWGSLVRSINEIKMHAKGSKFSCAHQPLVNIPLQNVVLDELHLMLRITDKLTKNLVMEMHDWDKEDNLNKRPMDRTNTHMDNLIKAINSCGVSFNVWQKMDANGRESGLLDYTSLMGSDKKLLLQKLPSKLGDVVKPETGETVIKLWKDFDELYELIQMQDPTSDKILDYFNKATRWINLFTSLGGTSLGYERARVTPYMHSMVYHVPRFMEKHQGIKKFTGQGVEKLNDDCRRVHLQRSNKWDAAKDVLLVGKRVEHLQALNCERNRRQYVKEDQNYWETGIVESRNKRKRICKEIPEEPLGIDLDTLTLQEIKSKLKDLGVLTKLRSRKKLQELLLDNLNNKENVE